MQLRDTQWRCLWGLKVSWRMSLWFGRSNAAEPQKIQLSSEIGPRFGRSHPAAILRGEQDPWRASDARSRDRADADAANTWQLDRRTADVEAGDEAQHVDLNALDPADRHAEEAAEGELDAGAAGGEAEEAPVGPPVLANGGRRQGDARLGNGGEHVGGERVGVGPRPHRVVAVAAAGIALDGGADRGDQGFRGRALAGPHQGGAGALRARVRVPVA